MPDQIKGNDRQREAICVADGPALILAGPGSGKTFVTVERIRHLITHHGIESSEILVITFTKAAAFEMQERFRRLMQGQHQAVRFGTFHAVFYYILRQSPRYREFTILTESEKRKILRKIVSQHREFACVREEDYEKLEQEIGRYKNRSDFGAEEAPVFLEFSQEDFLLLYREYQAFLTEFAKLDFDDIGILCEKLLTEDEAARRYWQSQFRYILVDEFQDICPLQYRLIRMLSMPQNNLFVVGDDDQSIYGFRGASPLCMQQFLRDYPNCLQITLEKNYRCHRDISDAAQKVIAANTERLAKTVTASHAEGDGIFCQIFTSREEEQSFLLQELQKRVQDGEAGHTAILCRTRYECTMQCQMLSQNRIPYTVREAPRSRFDFFAVQDLIAYLRLGAGNRERRVFLRVMNRPVRYLRRESLPEREVTRENWTAYYRGMPDLQQEIRKLFAGLERIGRMEPKLAIRYIRSAMGYDRYLREKYGAADVQEFIGRIEEFQEFAGGFASVSELLMYIDQYEDTIKRQRKAFYEKKGDAEDAEEKEGIRVMTMHSSKGLEFDCVCIPACEEGHIPSGRSVSIQAIEEERRMFYVAMTRARNKLLITAVKSKNGKETPSRFMEQLTDQQIIHPR